MFCYVFKISCFVGILMAFFVLQSKNTLKKCVNKPLYLQTIACSYGCKLHLLLLGNAVQL